MDPEHHVLLGLIFSIIIFLIFPSIGFLGATLIFLASFLIDFDHYLYYVYRQKNLNLKKAYKWYKIRILRQRNLSRKQRSKSYIGFYLFHSFEISILLLVLGFFVNNLFYFLFLGHFFHLFLDLLFQKKLQDRISRIFLVHDFLKLRKLSFIR